MTETVVEEKKDTWSAARRMFEMIMPTKTSESGPTSEDGDGSKSAKKTEGGPKKPRAKKKPRPKETTEETDAAVLVEASSMAPSSESIVKEGKPKRVKKKREIAAASSLRDSVSTSTKEAEGITEPKPKVKAKSSIASESGANTLNVKKSKKIDKKSNSLVCESGDALDTCSTVHLMDAIDQNGQHFKLKVDMIWQESFCKMLGNNSLGRTILDFFDNVTTEQKCKDPEDAKEFEAPVEQPQTKPEKGTKHLRNSLSARSAELVTPQVRRVPSLAERRKLAQEQAVPSFRRRPSFSRRVQSAKPDSIRRWQESRMLNSANSVANSTPEAPPPNRARPASALKSTLNERRLGRSFVRPERQQIQTKSQASPFRARALVIGCAPQVTQKATSPSVGRWRA